MKAYQCGISLPDNAATEMHEEFATLCVSDDLIDLLVISTLHRYIFRNIDPETGWAVRATALNTAARLRQEILDFTYVQESHYARGSDRAPFHCIC